MFLQSSHEEWVWPSHYVGVDAIKNTYKIPSWTDAPFNNIPIQVKYKDTDVWNLTYAVLCFGNRLLKKEFCQVLMFDLIVYENIQYFKLDWRSN